MNLNLFNNGYGRLHPITKTINELSLILQSLGFTILESSEIDTVANSFDYLNVDRNHPARSRLDTFYWKGFSDLLLRTHTSNSQIHAYRNFVNKEMSVFSVGKVYRRDEDDATHSHQFFQLEAFKIGKNISFAQLKETLIFFLKSFFGENCEFRFRPSFFPFTVPSLEIDVRCCFCFKNNGAESFFCHVCKNSHWIEVLGAGLVHPKVLALSNIPHSFSGMAFGVGIERLFMIKYKIKDIRAFYLNDLRFLQQF